MVEIKLLLTSFVDLIAALPPECRFLDEKGALVLYASDRKTITEIHISKGAGE